MIVYELQCGGRHRFEGWFASVVDFDGQQAAGQVSCPVCGDQQIARVPTARIQRGREERVPPPVQPEARGSPRITPEIVAAFVDRALATSEDVGERFPEEARRIHNGESDKRAVRGVATRDETAALLDEGILVMPLPVPAKKDWH
jgi:hypothetical protein